MVLRSLIDSDKGPRDKSGNQINNDNRLTLERVVPGFFNDIDFSYNPNK